MDLWQLPREAVLEGAIYPIAWDWRTAMEILTLLEDGRLPEWVRWYRAVKRFFRTDVPDRLVGEAARWMAEFLQAGQTGTPGRKLFDWQQDAAEILADVNRVAGVEVRDTDVHWWTFLGWFHAIGEGQFSMLVGIRAKLARGEKLTAQEQEFCRRNPSRVRLAPPPDPERARLEALLET